MKSNNNKTTKGKTNKFQNRKPATKFKNDIKFEETGNDAVKACKGGTHNDPAWYNKFPEIVDVSARLSWNTALGAERVINPNASDPGVLNSGSPIIDAGVATISYVPTFGVGTLLSDPVNKCAIELWSNYRYKLSGEAPYSPADIILIMEAADSLYQMVGWCERLYGILNLASPTNRYVPRILATAINADFDDFLSHKAEFSYFINSLIIQLAKINVPVGMTVFDRHFQLVSGIYRDEMIDRAQLYMFNPAVLWNYDQESATLKSFDFGDRATAWKFADIQGTAWAMLDQIQTMSGFYTMNANALGAYGYENMHKLVAMPSDWTVFPEYHPEVLAQIHNAMFAGNVKLKEDDSAATYFEVYENKTEGDPNVGAVTFRPKFSMRRPILAYENIVDIPWDSASIDDVMEATRLKVMGSRVANLDETHMSIEVTAAGTEIPTTIKCFYYFRAGTGWALTNTVFADADWSTTSVSILGGKFNSFPTYIHFDGTLGDGFTPAYVYGQISNFATIGSDQLQNIHEAAILSELAVGRINMK